MFVCGCLNTVSEFVVALLPVLAVFKLGVTPRQRWSVIGLLSLGFLVTFTGCLRTYYVYRITQTYDITWWAAPQWVCAEVEIDVALVSPSDIYHECSLIPSPSNESLLNY